MLQGGALLEAQMLTSGIEWNLAGRGGGNECPFWAAVPSGSELIQVLPYPHLALTTQPFAVDCYSSLCCLFSRLLVSTA